MFLFWWQYCTGSRNILRLVSYPFEGEEKGGGEGGGVVIDYIHTYDNYIDVACNIVC